MKEIYFSNFGKNNPMLIKDSELANWLKNNYSFETAFIPDGYDVAFLLEKANNNPELDEWKVLFFKKINAVTTAITLDNINDLNLNNNLNFTEMKSYNTNFQGVLDTSVSLIDNYKDDLKQQFL